MYYYGKISLTAGKGGSGRTEINGLVDRKIGFRIDVILFQNVFKYHFRHTAGASAENGLSLQHIPLEIINWLSGNQKVSGPLGELRKI